MAGGSVAGCTVGVWGLTFKAGTDDLRSSPALALLWLLRARGAKVRAYDPIVAREQAAKAGLDQLCEGDLESVLKGADAALLTTADPVFLGADWVRMTSSMRSAILIDGRNALRNVDLPASVRYYAIGRGGLFPELETVA